MNRTFVLRGLLIMVCLSHLILGAVPQFGTALVETTGRLAYGAAVDLTPQLHHVLRMLGAFMIGIGVMAAFAWKDPLANRQIVIGIGIILILRASQRVLFSSAIQDAFQISLQQLVLQGVFFFTLGVALIWLTPRPVAAHS